MKNQERKLLEELAENAEKVIHLLSEGSMSQPQKDLKTKISEVKVCLGQCPTFQADTAVGGAI